eukprot:gene36431-47435_t
MGSKSDDVARSMREIVQKKFLDDVLGAAAASSTTGWMVLVMDDRATRVISSALSMYDVMEKKITLVESLARSRQPFKEMEVLYIISSSIDSVKLVVADFESEKKSKYAGVHLYFLDKVDSEIMSLLQSSPVLINHIKTFKEIYMNFISAENNAFHLDANDALPKLYGPSPEPDYTRVIATRLATLCITLNELPMIRYQSSSRFAYEIAAILTNILQEHKLADTTGTFWCHGEEGHMDRERGQLLILDRSYDPISPLMHEYTYQSMIYDLLPVQENTISYTVHTNGGEQLEKTVLLNENDELWLEFRHQHIARVISMIKDRMNDVIQHNPGASLQKNSGADLSITDMAAAVKELPEYRETMSKLAQHVQITQKCMDALTRLGLMEISQIEQTMSTGADEDGKEVKGAALVQLLLEKLSSPSVSKLQKIRLLAIFLISQRTATQVERQQVMNAAQLTGAEQQILLNFEKLVIASQPVVPGQNKSTLFNMFKFKSKPAPKHAPTPEGEYADTRHISEFRTILDSIIAGDLPKDKYPAFGSDALEAMEQKAAAKSARRAAAPAKYGWGKKDNVTYSGRRQMVFIGGGISYAELRVAHDVMVQHSKEILVGSTHFMSPDTFVKDVAQLAVDSANVVSHLTV